MSFSFGRGSEGGGKWKVVRFTLCYVTLFFFHSHVWRVKTRVSHRSMTAIGRLNRRRQSQVPAC